MMDVRVLKALACSLVVWACSAWGAFAHALPDSVVTLARVEDQLSVTISLPLEDLLIAEPTLADLENAPVAEELSVLSMPDLVSYLGAHIALHHGEIRLPLSLRSAALRWDKNDHVGEFKVLTVQMTSPWQDPEGAMALLYDIVMHEIRNHRAQVFWETSDDTRALLADFGYKAIDGATQPVLIRLP